MIADRLAKVLPKEGFDILKETGATIDLVRRLKGYDRLVVIDAIQLGNVPIGTVHHFRLKDLEPMVRRSSAHDINFATAFAMARELGYPVPDDIRIYAVEVRDIQRFSEGCTEEVRAKMDGIVYRVLADLGVAAGAD